MSSITYSSGGGGGSQNLQQVCDIGYQTDTPVKVADLRLYDADNDQYGLIYLTNGNYLFSGDETDPSAPVKLALGVSQGLILTSHSFQQFKTTVITTNYAVDDEDRTVAVGDTGGSITITLPPVASSEGRTIVIQNIFIDIAGSHFIKLKPSTGEKIQTDIDVRTIDGTVNILKNYYWNARATCVDGTWYLDNPIYQF